MIKILEAVPLIIFLGSLRIVNLHIPDNWKIPFIISGCAAIIIILVSFYKKTVLNRILLGFNLYFISGAIAFITNQYWLNQFYDQLQASGLLLWLCGCVNDKYFHRLAR